LLVVAYPPFITISSLSKVSIFINVLSRYFQEILSVTVSPYSPLYHVKCVIARPDPIAFTWTNGIRDEEFTQNRVIEPGPLIVEAQIVILLVVKV